MFDRFALYAVSVFLPTVLFADVPAFNDATPQRYKLTARASELDPKTKEHPEIDFVFERRRMSRTLRSIQAWLHRVSW